MKERKLPNYKFSGGELRKTGRPYVFVKNLNRIKLLRNLETMCKERKEGKQI